MRFYIMINYSAASWDKSYRLVVLHLTFTIAGCLLRDDIFARYVNRSAVLEEPLFRTSRDVASQMMCEKEMGCFNNDVPFYHPILRPINVLPFSRKEIDTTFLLYTKRNPKTPQKLKSWDDDLETSLFDPYHDTKFIIHGFIDNIFLGKWMETLKDEFFKHGNYNVVIVDWKGGNIPPYSQATSNTRVVGVEVALFIQKLQKVKGIRPETCHLIGHSLGAHVAGYAGERLKNLGRITGLDPAKPFFQHMSPQVRLDPTDAMFVDVIHTDTLPPTGLGIRVPVGHVDFYPNGGFRQPGCMIQRFFSWFMEGLNQGKCGCRGSPDECIPFGMNSEKGYVAMSSATRNSGLTTPVKFFLKTSSKAPFCVFQYQVLVRLSKTRKFKPTRGLLYLTLYSQDKVATFRLSERDEELRAGRTYTYLISSKGNVDPYDRIHFEWSNADPFAFWLSHETMQPALFLTSITIHPLQPSVNSAAKPVFSSRTFCWDPSKPIPPNTSVILKTTSCH